MKLSSLRYRACPSMEPSGLDYNLPPISRWVYISENSAR